MESVKLSADQQRLAADNRGLAYHFAKQFHRQTGNNLEDLEGEALAALCKAAYHFDPERGFKFSTFACRAIINRLVRFVELERRESRPQFSQLGDEDFSADSFGHDEAEHELDALEQVERLRKKLPRRLFKILKLRFADEMLLRQIAGRYRISKERVRQLCTQAMQRIA